MSLAVGRVQKLQLQTMPFCVTATESQRERTSVESKDLLQFVECSASVRIKMRDQYLFTHVSARDNCDALSM